MNVEDLKINKSLSIKPVPTILLNGEIWPHQNLIKHQDELSLETLIQQEVKNNKSFYTFHRLKLDHTFRVYINETPVGNRLNHGNGGKQGKHFPVEATVRHLTRKEAEDAMNKLKWYFLDLALNSMWGEKTKQVGQIRSNHFLFS